MKIVERILYGLAILCALLCLFIFACAGRPEVAEKVAGFLYPAQNKTASVKTDEPAENKDSPLPEDSLRPGLEAYQPVGGGQPDGSGENAGSAGIAQEVVQEYIPPDESALAIPEKVAGRNGYEGVRDESEQVDDEEAQRLLEQLDEGNTGDGLAFDPRYYPYYAMLDGAGQRLYRQIYANAGDLYDAFAPVEKVNAQKLKNVFAAVVNDHPELFWVQTGYLGKFTADGQCVELDLSFNRTAQNLDSEKAVFEEKAENIASQARSQSGDYDKEKYVHDALIGSISYNKGAEMNQSAYSALVNGQTVCAGYARAFQYVLQKLGIPCYYCTGFAGENHAWNIVSLDDGYYNVDTTWDDVDSGNYDYFNKSDADYAGDHVRKELSVYLPPCNGQKYRGLEPESGAGETGNAGAVDSGNGSVDIDFDIDTDRLRSLDDVGMTQDQVITDIQEYYKDCYGQMAANGVGAYVFYNVIDGALLGRWADDLDQERFWDAFMRDAVADAGAAEGVIIFSVEKLQGERYLITHDTAVR